MIETQNLTKIHICGSQKIYAINNVSLSIENGEIVSIIGPSGSGKTTLMNVIGCLDNPTSGILKINGKQINTKLSESELTYIRRNVFGYVFQKFFLIPTLNVKENVLLPSIFNRENTPSEKNIQSVMEMLDIAKRKNHLPKQLSGGEMQRVAIARAIINNPKILIADEPTGNLDSKHSDEIKELLIRLNKENGITIILVTHNHELAKIGTKILEIIDGKINKSRIFV